LKREQPDSNWRASLHEIIYEADSKKGKIFDLVIIVAIVFSIILVMLESVKSLDERYHNFLMFLNGS
jgi:voltage-gated potassium channel